MPFNGSGTFVRLYNWVQDKANNIKILASRMDNEMDGFATGLSTCLTKDGQTTPTADLTLGGFKFTTAGKAVGYNQYMTAEQIIENEFIYYTTSGTDTYTITPSPSITAYTAGLGLRVKIGTTNTGTSTLNVNALGAKTIKTPTGADVVAGELPSGAIVDLVYDGTNFIISQYQSKVAALTSGTISGATITTGSINNTPIGATTAATGAFTTLTATSIALSGGTTLSNYTEGTFTPSAYGAGTAGSPTFSTQQGTYTRVGRIVYYIIRLNFSNLGGMVGAIRLSGLPFTATSRVGQAEHGETTGLAASTYTFASFVQPSTSEVWLYKQGSGGTSTVVNTDLTNTTALYITGFYFV